MLANGDVVLEVQDGNESWRQQEEPSRAGVIVSSDHSQSPWVVVLCLATVAGSPHHWLELSISSTAINIFLPRLRLAVHPCRPSLSPQRPRHTARYTTTPGILISKSLSLSVSRTPNLSASSLCIRFSSDPYTCCAWLASQRLVQNKQYSLTTHISPSTRATFYSVHTRDYIMFIFHLCAQQHSTSTDTLRILFLSNHATWSTSVNNGAPS